jgi:hypothetical protein
MLRTARSAAILFKFHMKLKTLRLEILALRKPIFEIVKIELNSLIIRYLNDRILN